MLAQISPEYALYPWPGDDEPGGGDQGIEEPIHNQGGDEPFPGLAFMLQRLPDVVEDGTHGVVWFTPLEGDGVGPAWLERGDQSERLFRGWWVDRATVEAYAGEYGHDFHCDDQTAPEPDDGGDDHGR